MQGKSSGATLLNFLLATSGPSLAVTPASVQVDAGATAQLTADWSPGNGVPAEAVAATWQSADATVATVSATGVITGVAGGQRTVVTATYDGVSGQAIVQVVTPALAGITVSPSAVKLAVGQQQTLTVTGQFANGATGPVTSPVIWSISHAQVSAVSSSGAVTWRALGELPRRTTKPGRAGAPLGPSCRRPRVGGMVGACRSVRAVAGGASMEVIPLTPRGYCYGVVDALTLAQRVAADPHVPRPIHVLGMIVHNRHVVDELSRQGIVTVDGADRAALLERIDLGTVIFTAHGVSPQVKARARARGLTCFDATCPDVTRTHEVIGDRAARGVEIIYIGKKGHPEPEGAMGVAPGHVHLIETEADLDALRLPEGPVAVVTQTTLSQWDTQALINACRRRYPQAEVWNEICRATQERQEAVATQAGSAELLLVVGDARSNNSNRLVQVAREIAGRPAYRIDSVEDIRPEWLAGVRTVAVTAGSSTPTQLTKQVIDYLRALPPGEAAPPPPARSAAVRLPGAGGRARV